MLREAKKNRWILVFLSLLIIFACYVRLAIIKGSLPYVGHPDEPALTAPSLKILKTGDFNPHTFVYPSLPFYLTAASFVVGYVNSVSHREIRNTKELDPVTYPFFSEKRVVFPAKLIFAILSVIGMVLTGVIAYSIIPNRHLIYLGPLLLALSSLYLYHSARYLNVDIIGSFFAILAIFYITLKLKRDSYLEKALMPGILCGLSIASKYNYYLLLIPAVLAVIFYSRKKKLEKTVLLSAAAMITFLVCVPYSLLDFDTFLDGIGFNIYHYQAGHTGFTGQAGLPQLIYYSRALIAEYGIGILAFALIGLLYSLISKPKKGLVLFSLPFFLLIYISSLSVHFLRNILVIYVFVCLYCGLGIVFSYKYLHSWLKKFRFINQMKLMPTLLSLLLIVAAVTAFLPREKIIQAYNLKPDSRNLARDWIGSNVPPGSMIYVPQELDWDTRGLEKLYRMIFYHPLSAKGDLPQFSSGSYVLVPHYGYDRRGLNGKRISSRLNARFETIDKVAEFGKNPVLVNYSRPVPAGNPKFSIGKIP
jgi:4-amino-4-deoxy-L-arabinose transferase-like glycosyltransferase